MMLLQCHTLLTAAARAVGAAYPRCAPKFESHLSTPHKPQHRPIKKKTKPPGQYHQADRIGEEGAHHIPELKRIESSGRLGGWSWPCIKHSGHLQSGGALPISRASKLARKLMHSPNDFIGMRILVRLAKHPPLCLLKETQTFIRDIKIISHAEASNFSISSVHSKNEHLSAFSTTTCLNRSGRASFRLGSTGTTLRPYSRTFRGKRTHLHELG